MPRDWKKFESTLSEVGGMRQGNARGEDLIARLRTIYNQIVIDGRDPSIDEVRHVECIANMVVGHFNLPTRQMDDFVLLAKEFRAWYEASVAKPTVTDVTKEIYALANEKDPEHASQMLKDIKSGGLAVKHVSCEKKSLNECIAAAKADAASRGEDEPEIVVIGKEDNTDLKAQIAKAREDAFVQAAADSAVNEGMARGTCKDKEELRASVVAAATALYRDSIAKHGRGPSQEEATAAAVCLSRKASKYMIKKAIKGSKGSKGSERGESSKAPMLDAKATAEAVELAVTQTASEGVDDEKAPLSAKEVIDSVHSFLDNKPEGYDQSRSKQTVADTMMMHKTFKQMLDGENVVFDNAFLLKLEGAEKVMKSGDFGDGVLRAWAKIDASHPRGSYEEGDKGRVEWHRARWCQIQQIFDSAPSSELSGCHERLTDQMNSDMKPVLTVDDGAREDHGSHLLSRQQRKALTRSFEKAMNSLPPVPVHRKPDGTPWPDMMTYASKEEQKLVGVDDEALFSAILKNMPADHPVRPGLVETLVKNRKRRLNKDATANAVCTVEDVEGVQGAARRIYECLQVDPQHPRERLARLRNDEALVASCEYLAGRHSVGWQMVLGLTPSNEMQTRARLCCQLLRLKATWPVAKPSSVEREAKQPFLRDGDIIEMDDKALEDYVWANIGYSYHARIPEAAEALKLPRSMAIRQLLGVCTGWTKEFMRGRCVAELVAEELDKAQPSQPSVEVAADELADAMLDMKNAEAKERAAKHRAAVAAARLKEAEEEERAARLALQSEASAKTDEATKHPFDLALECTFVTNGRLVSTSKTWTVDSGAKFLELAIQNPALLARGEPRRTEESVIEAMPLTRFLCTLLNKDDVSGIFEYFSRITDKLGHQESIFMRAPAYTTIFVKPSGVLNKFDQGVVRKLTSVLNEDEYYLSLGSLAIAYNARNVLAMFMKKLIDDRRATLGRYIEFDRMAKACLRPDRSRLHLLHILAAREWVPRNWLDTEGHQMDCVPMKHTMRLWELVMSHINSRADVDTNLRLVVAPLLQKMFFDGCVEAGGVHPCIQTHPDGSTKHVVLFHSIGSFIMELIEDIIIANDQAEAFHHIMRLELNVANFANDENGTEQLRIVKCYNMRQMLEMACGRFGVPQYSYFEKCILTSVRANSFKCFEWILTRAFILEDEGWFKHIYNPTRLHEIKRATREYGRSDKFLTFLEFTLTEYQRKKSDLHKIRAEDAAKQSNALVAEERVEKLAEAVKQTDEYKEMVRMKNQAEKEREKLAKQKKAEREAEQRAEAQKQRAEQERTAWAEEWKSKLENGAKYADKNFDEYHQMLPGKERDRKRATFWKRRELFYQLSQTDRTELETRYSDVVKAFLDKYDEKKAIEKPAKPKSSKSPVAPVAPPPIVIPTTPDKESGQPSSSSSQSPNRDQLGKYLAHRIEKHGLTDVLVAPEHAPKAKVDWNDPRVAIASRKQKKQLAAGELSPDDLPPPDVFWHDAGADEATLRFKREQMERERIRVEAEARARAEAAEADRMRSEVQPQKGGKGVGRGSSGRGGRGGRGGGGGGGRGVDRVSVVGLADAPAFAARPPPESTLGGETTCGICFLGEKDHAAVPCGHMCVCMTCSKMLKECPICRTHVSVWVKVHVA